MSTDEIVYLICLQEFNAEFENISIASTAYCCAAPSPLKLKRSPRSVDLEPNTLVNCATAEATACFISKVLALSAKAQFSKEVVSIDQA